MTNGHNDISEQLNKTIYTSYSHDVPKNKHCIFILIFPSCLSFASISRLEFKICIQLFLVRPICNSPTQEDEFQSHLVSFLVNFSLFESKISYSASAFVDNNFKG